MSARVLIVDDDPAMVVLIERHLGAEGLATTGVTSGEAAAALLEHERFAVILTDLVMEGVDGLELLRRARRLQPQARVILMTAFGSVPSAVAALREGAADYLTKPFKLAEVSESVRRALGAPRRADTGPADALEALEARSPAMQAFVAQLREVAASEATVLLLGESGSGKELAARSLHRASPRRHGPFVPINCAAIPESLLESELFGHEKGAFTGAAHRRRGLFAEAHGGTLFLDEVAEMPVPLQAKLLRALQDKAVRPVGGRDEVRVDVRIVSATNRDLAARVRDGRFREDLYYRLAVIPLRLPSLRERPEDILPLARQFLARAAGAAGKALVDFSPEARSWLEAYRWPGNVRELENLVERAVALARGPVVHLDDLRPDLTGPLSPDTGVRPTLAELEDSYIRRVLAETRGDKRAAARILGVSVRTLQRRMPRARDAG
ncbi:MAG TPA: sigma-54 dependent transcriptional regulator [Candidatus Binatia bacterium]|nr:sigma-54 dependent transcriptional regulator [Candidatus Binatia bacterium]